MFIVSKRPLERIAVVQTIERNAHCIAVTVLATDPAESPFITARLLSQQPYELVSLPLQTRMETVSRS